MALNPNDIARLVHHYLVKEGYQSAAESFVSVCPHLSGLRNQKNHNGTTKLPRLLGPSLSDLIEEYLDVKDQVVDELDQLGCPDYRSQDSLPTLSKILVAELKKNQISRIKDVRDVGTNTDECVEPEDPSPSDSDCVQDGEDEWGLPSVDFSAMYDRLLEDTQLHEKIAENINKKISSEASNNLKYCDRLLSASSSHNSAPIQDIVKAVMEETQADPVFENILNDFFGRDLEAQVPAPDPESANCEETDVRTPAPGSATSDPMARLSPSSVPQVTDMGQAVSAVSSFAIVTSVNGEVTLVPSVLSAITGLSMSPVKHPAAKTTPPRRSYVPIAPKPLVPVIQATGETPAIGSTSQHSEVAARVDSAVSEALADFDEELSLQPINSEHPPIRVKIAGGRLTVPTPTKLVEILVPSDAAPCEPHPDEAAEGSKTSKRPRRRKSKCGPPDEPHSVQNPTNSSLDVSKASPASASAGSGTPVSPGTSRSNTDKSVPIHTPSLFDLVKLASKALNEEAAVSQVSSKSPSGMEAAKPTPPESVKSATTPTNSRRRNHVRVLDFDTKNEEGAKKTKSSGVPWDARLRQLTASGDNPTFAAPKGKAKRTRKSSPVQEPNLTQPDPSPLVAVPEVPSVASTSVSSESETPPTVPVTVPGPSVPSAAPATVEEADSVTAQLLSEIVNSGTKDTHGSAHSFPPPGNEPGPNAGATAHPVLPSLFTPQKVGEPGPAPYETTSSSYGFGWVGEVPRTPQIITDGASSSSPFLVSLTKGFQFLPMADTPSLVATPSIPLTPSISNYQSSVETPFASFSRLGILSTPRVEALRQELLESPAKDSSTMISPTQFVLGRSTPYFVPSGERARGPCQQIATPEHEPSTEVRKRRADGTELGRNQESDDVPGPMEGRVSSCLRFGTPEDVPANPKDATPICTPVKCDEKLEKILIGECQRLNDSLRRESPGTLSNQPDGQVAPPNRKLIQKYVELFGEDSTLSAIKKPPQSSSCVVTTPPVPSSSQVFQNTSGSPALHPAASKSLQKPDSAKNSPRVATREAIAAWWNQGKVMEQSPSGQCQSSRFQDGSKTSQGTRDPVRSPESDRKSLEQPPSGERCSKTSQGKSLEPTGIPDDQEEVIQELILMATRGARIDLSLSYTESKSRKRKSVQSDLEPPSKKRNATDCSRTNADESRRRSAKSRSEKRATGTPREGRKSTPATDSARTKKSSRRSEKITVTRPSSDGLEHSDDSPPIKKRTRRSGSNLTQGSSRNLGIRPLKSPEGPCSSKDLSRSCETPAEPPRSSSADLCPGPSPSRSKSEKFQSNQVADKSSRRKTTSPPRSRTSVSPNKNKTRPFRTPPKLFKSQFPPYGRKAISFRQSTGGSVPKSSVPEPSENPTPVAPSGGGIEATDCGTNGSEGLNCSKIEHHGEPGCSSNEVKMADAGGTMEIVPESVILPASNDSRLEETTEVPECSRPPGTTSESGSDHKVPGDQTGTGEPNQDSLLEQNPPTAVVCEDGEADVPGTHPESPDKEAVPDSNPTGRTSRTSAAGGDDNLNFDAILSDIAAADEVGDSSQSCSRIKNDQPALEALERDAGPPIPVEDGAHPDGTGTFQNKAEPGTRTGFGDSSQSCSRMKNDQPALEALERDAGPPIPVEDGAHPNGTGTFQNKAEPGTRTGFSDVSATIFTSSTLPSRESKSKKTSPRKRAGRCSKTNNATCDVNENVPFDQPIKSYLDPSSDGKGSVPAAGQVGNQVESSEQPSFDSLNPATQIIMTNLVRRLQKRLVNSKDSELHSQKGPP